MASKKSRTDCTSKPDRINKPVKTYRNIKNRQDMQTRQARITYTADRKDGTYRSDNWQVKLAREEGHTD